MPIDWIDTGKLDADPAFKTLVDCAISTPRGYAYVRTACVAAMMGVSLDYEWRKHGKALLAAIEKARRAAEGRDA